MTQHVLLTTTRPACSMAPGVPDVRVLGIEGVSMDAMGLPEVDSGGGVAVRRQGVLARGDNPEMLDVDAEGVVARMVRDLAFGDRSIEALPRVAMCSQPLTVQRDLSVTLEEWPRPDVASIAAISMVKEYGLDAVGVMLRVHAEQFVAQFDKARDGGVSTVHSGEHHARCGAIPARCVHDGSSRAVAAPLPDPVSSSHLEGLIGGAIPSHGTQPRGSGL